MAEDYYKTLGVSKTASDDEIHKAYLGLARKYHPDMNPDDPEGAKKKFQEIQAAFDVLKDPEKRKQYDQFGAGFDQFGGAGGGGYQQWSGSHGGTGFEGNINLDDIFKMFGGGGGQAGGFSFGGGGGGSPFGDFTGAGSGTASGRTRRRKAGPVKGESFEIPVEIPFQTAIRGGKVPVNFRRNDGKIESVEVKIPTGIESNQKIRLRGMGGPGSNGGEAGDLILEVHIKEHPFYTRKGNNLYVKVPVTLKEAALGTKIDVPTPNGTITITVPPGTTTGTKLRLRNQGIQMGNTEGQLKEANGDLYIEFEVQLPKSWSKADQDLINKLDSNLSPPVRSTLYF